MSTTIIHTSDPHSRHQNLPRLEGDILIVSGDVCARGSQAELIEALAWMAAYPCPARILVPGNHDYYIAQERQAAQALCASYGVTLLIDELLTIGGLRIYGFPWIEYQERFQWPDSDRAFCLCADDPRLANALAAIPTDIDILVSHAPALGIGDQSYPDSYWRGFELEQAGSGLLRQWLDRHPELGGLCFGHVHDNPGVQRYNQTWCSNAAGIVVALELADRQVISSRVVLAPALA